MTKARQKSKKATLPRGLSGEQLDRLYSADPGEFVVRRNELATELREAGKAEAAADVAARRKPTVAAWLINQLAHRDPDQLQRFLAATEDLANAQSEALSGSGGQHLRKAQRTQRDAIQALVQAARGIDEGASEATLDRLRGTLEAATESAELRELVERGQLQQEARPGSVPNAPPSRTMGKSTEKREDEARDRRELARLRRELRDAEGEEEQLAEQVESAEQRLSEVRAELRAARKAVRKARQEAKSAETRLG